MAEVTATNPQGAGRPKSTPQEIADRKAMIVRKIEPYLRSGLSLHKSILESKVVKSELYQFMNEDEEFRDLINTFKQFPSVLLNNAVMSELQTIIKKQNGYTTASGRKIAPQKLDKSDREFLWRYATLSNMTKDEYGNRSSLQLFDPESAIQKVKSLMEGTSEEIDHN